VLCCVVFRALSGPAADAVLFGVLVLVLVLGKLLATVVHCMLRVRMFVIPMFVTVPSVALNQTLNLVL
jgi:hypothetical protein